MTEENARHGDAGKPEVPPAGRRWSGRAAPARRVRERPGHPAQAVDAAHLRNADHPAGRDRRERSLRQVPKLRRRSPGAPPDGRAGSTHRDDGRKQRRLGAGMAGAAKLVSANAARLGRWVRRQSLPRIGAAAVVLVVVGLLVWLLAATLGGAEAVRGGELPRGGCGVRPLPPAADRFRWKA